MGAVVVESLVSEDKDRVREKEAIESVKNTAAFITAVRWPGRWILREQPPLYQRRAGAADKLTLLCWAKIPMFEVPAAFKALETTFSKTEFLLPHGFMLLPIFPPMAVS